jgi:hypothetical protein
VSRRYVIAPGQGALRVSRDLVENSAPRRLLVLPSEFASRETVKFGYGDKKSSPYREAADPAFVDQPIARVAADAEFGEESTW